MAVEGAQLQGRVLRRYGVLLHHGGWREADLHRRADDFLLPFEAVAIRNASVAPTRPAVGSALCLSGAEVSAVLRDDGQLLVRVHNPTPEPATARLATPSGGPVTGAVVDLTGAESGRFSGEVALRPAEIVTLRLDGIA